MNFLKKTFFFFVFFLAFSGIVSTPVALALGLAFGLSFTHPYPKESRTAAKILLQGSVVALGFGMNLHEVLKAGRSGFVYTALGITFALVVGLALGKLLHVRGNSSYLITAGTAICGGQRHRCSRADPSRRRRRDGGFTGHNLHSKFRGAHDFPGDWRSFAALAIAVRTLGCAGDSRYQLGCGRLRKIRERRAGNWNYSEARAGSLDRSPGAGYRSRQTQPFKDSFSLVHFVVCRRSGD